MNVNPLAPPLSGTMEVAEFMAFLETRPHGEHWELIEGVAVMMATPSLAHQRVAMNFCELLNRGLSAQGLDFYAYHEIAIRLPGVINFQPEPDVVVAHGMSGRELFAEHFLLVAEVLSPSNTRTEIDLKLRRYRESPDNLYSVVIEPYEFFVEIHAKSRGWRPSKITAPDDLIEMPEFGLSCRVADLYRGTPLDPQREGVA